MIPLSLTLQGIYSYQTRQTIDFKRLLNTHLFGVFGAVGSGKSTILEAITFALYGRIERLNQKDGQAYNMLNLKSNELYIEYIFLAGKNHHDEYKIVVSNKRNKKQFEEVKASQRQLFVKQNEGWLPLEDKTAEHILGLSYENFKRTVIIPQGKFQEFIQLGATERTQMLMELFSLQRFDLYYKVVGLETENNLAGENLRGKLSQINAQATPEIIKAYEEQIVALEQQLQLLTQQQLDLSSQAHSLENLKLQFEKWQIAKTQWQSLVAQKITFEKQETQLTLYELCLRNFSDVLRQLESDKLGLAQNTAQAQSLEEKISKEQKAWESVSTALMGLETQYQQKDLFKEQEQDLKKLIEIAQIQEKLKENIKEREKIETTLKQHTEEQTKLKKEYDDQEKDIKRIKASQPDASLLNQIQQWFIEQKHLQEKAQKARCDQAQATLKIEQLQKEKELLLQATSDWLTPTEKNMKIKQISSILENKVIAFNQDIQSLDLQIQEHSGQEKLIHYAASLKEHSPCPLCGSLHHPQILKVEDLSLSLKGLQKRKEKIQASIISINQTLTQLSQLYGFVSAAFHTQEENSTLTRALQEQIINHVATFAWKDYTVQDEARVQNEILYAKQTKEALQGQEDSLEKKKITLENKNLALEESKKSLENIRLTTTALLTQKQTLLQQLARLDHDEYAQKDIFQLQQEESALRQKVTTLEKEYERMKSEDSQMSKNLSGLKGQFQEKVLQIAQAKEALSKQEGEIAVRLVNSGLHSLEEIASILAKKLDIATLKKELENYKNSLHSKQTELDIFEQQLRGKNYEATQHDLLKEQLSALNHQISQLTAQKGSLTTTISDLLAQMNTQSALMTQLQANLQRAENLDILKKLFKSSGFVNYISTQYLQNLANEANHRFYKLTKQQLKLEINEANEFIVRDLLNDGRTRSVKTLSGGQTFQAALSMALTLADQVNHLAGIEQNFFFMDEGFGSLDKDSLRIVFDSLKSLHKENRVVGVISHVEELQQDIDTYLQITNTPELGSIIKASWY